jgi:hypothetical protein
MRYISIVSTTFVSALSTAMLFAACAEAPDELAPAGDVAFNQAAATLAIPTVAGRSLAITAASVLQPCLTDAGLTSCGSNGESPFALRRTLNVILRSANVPLPTSGEPAANALLRQLWDTQNTIAGAQTALGNPQCDDVKTAGGLPAINGFPIQCPRNEGSMAAATTDMLTPSSPAYFYPIALMNRLDLRDAAATTCGEFRIIYGRKDAAPGAPTGRALIIFEAALPNPRPSLGVAGCQPIADLWARLSDPAVTAAAAQAALVPFYFQGVTVAYPDGVTATTVPVMQFQNLGAQRGQIRVNGFLNGGNEARWQLREFKTQQPISGRLTIRPEYVKANPWPGLFAAATGSDAFSTWFVGQVPNLLQPSLTTFFLDDNSSFGAGQSDSHTAIEGPTGDITQFSNDYAPFASPALAAAVQTKLTQLGSTLTPTNVFHRATAMSCGGCHQHSNGDNLGGGLVWPASGGFVHVDETPAISTPAPDAFGQATRSFRISPALTNVFLPARMTDLRCVAFGECPPLAPLAGLRSE